jgi:hypothetical protein
MIGFASTFVRDRKASENSNPMRPSAANPIFNIPKIVTVIGRCRIFFL